MILKTKVLVYTYTAWWSGYHLINVDPCEIVRKEIYGTHTQMSIYCVYNIGCLSCKLIICMPNMYIKQLKHYTQKGKFVESGKEIIR
jgi:hypothetical protein